MTLHPPRDQSLQDHRGGPGRHLDDHIANQYPDHHTHQLATPSGHGHPHPCPDGTAGRRTLTQGGPPARPQPGAGWPTLPAHPPHRHTRSKPLMAPCGHSPPSAAAGGARDPAKPGILPEPATASGRYIQGGNSSSAFHPAAKREQRQPQQHRASQAQDRLQQLPPCRQRDRIIRQRQRRAERIQKAGPIRHRTRRA
jgi:hypothetical protein